MCSFDILNVCVGVCVRVRACVDDWFMYFLLVLLPELQ